MSSELIVGTDVPQENHNLVSEGFFRVGDAAVFLKVGRSKIYELMQQGELRYAKIGRARRIPRRAVFELAEKSLIGAAT